MKRRGFLGLLVGAPLAFALKGKVEPEPKVWSMNQDGEDVDWEMHGAALELEALGVERVETAG